MAAAVRSIALNSGYKMPIVGLGTWKSTTGEVKEAVKAAIDVGYRHIDCAWGYNNEEEVGAAIREKIAEGVIAREDLFITSKVWNTKHSVADARANLEDSLRKLGLNYLDLYLVHWPMAFKAGDAFLPKDADGKVLYADTHYMETWGALEQAVDDGLIKSIGVSNFNSEQIQEVIDKGRIKPVVNQVEIHPYLSQEDLSRFCQERGVAMTAYSPLGSPDRPWASPEEPSLLDDPQIKEMAVKYNKTSAQIILHWLVQRDIIVIPKSVTPSRIKENFEIFDFELSPQDMAVVSSFNRNCRLIVPFVTVNGKRVYRDSAAPYFPFNIPF